MIDGLKQGLKIAQNEYFRQYATLFPNLIPSCDEHICHLIYHMIDSTECESYLRCVIEHLTSSYHHPVGTCRMGPSTQPLAVVDERLRVKDVTGLRVIDASIMPEIPNAPTNAATIMIAEKGAKLIFDDYNNN